MSLSTRKLTSILMIAGPIGVFAIWGILTEAIVGSSDVDGIGNAGLFLQNANSAGSIAGLLEIFGLLFFVAQMFGLVLFARQLSSEGQSGSAFANIAALLGIVSSASIIIGTDFGVAAMKAGDNGVMEDAMVLAQIYSHSGALFGIFIALSFGMVSIPMIGQASTSLKKYLGFALGILCAVLFVIELFRLDIGDIVQFIVWIGFTLVFVTAGFLNLKEE